jgi:hypothetical protein
MAKSLSGAGLIGYAKLAAGTLLLLIVIWLAFDVLRPGSSSCEAIFQQTESQFGAKLKYLNAEGSIVLGRQQIQSLTEKSQLAAINLKACCVMQQSGGIQNSDFNLCKKDSSRFEEKLARLQAEIDKFSVAASEGNKQAQKTSREQINSLVAEAAKSADVIERKVDSLPRAPLRKTGNEYFRDDFDTETLNQAWQIRHPDNNRWALQSEKSSLLIVTQKGSLWKAKKDLLNLFVLNYAMPEEDFILETHVSIPIQNQQNGASLALWKDDDNFLQIGYRGFPHGYNVRRSPFFLKEVNAKVNLTETDAGRIGGVRSAESIYLRIVKRGNSFAGYYALSDKDSAYDGLKWQLITTHAVPNFIGRPALWADNNDGEVYSTGNSVSPEVPVEYQYLSVKAIE